MLPSCLSGYPEEWLSGFQQTPEQLLELVIQRKRQQQLLGAWIWLNENRKQGRKRRCLEFDWENHVRGAGASRRESSRRGKARYRLTPFAFYNLLNLIEKEINLDEKAKRQGRNGRSGAEPLEPAVRLAIALRMFAGASYLDLMLIYKVRSSRTIYKCMWDCVAAINQALEVVFPLGVPTKLNTLEAEFRSNSPGQVWEGCVGCIDGVHFKMLKPSLKDVPNPTKYYVARKGCYALLCMGICDYARRFTFFSMEMTSTTHDSMAWSATTLAQQIANGELPFPFHLVGDNAFSNSNSMITPSGTDTHFDFYQSSTRMPIECSFGILIKRFGILWKPLSMAFHLRAPLIGCLMRLHNFCIDHSINEEMRVRTGEGGVLLGQVQPDRWEPMPLFDKEGRPVEYLKTVDHPLDTGGRERVGGMRTTAECFAMTEAVCTTTLPKNHLRDKLMASIEEMGLSRPSLPRHCVPNAKGRQQKDGQSAKKRKNSA